MPVVEVVRAYRFALDVPPAGIEVLERHAGAARWGFNYAHQHLLDRYQAYDARREAAALTISGLSPEERLDVLSKAERTALYRQAGARVRAENARWCADLKVLDEHRKRVAHMGKPALDPGEEPGPDAGNLARDLYARRVELAALQCAAPGTYSAERKAELGQVRPRVQALKTDLAARGAYRLGAMDLNARWRLERDLPREEGGSPWWREVHIDAILCGIARADTAWKNWLSSAAGKRRGRRVGAPRFKSKRTARDSFTLHNPDRVVVHLPDYRHLSVRGLGTFRLHDTAKRLVRLMRCGQAEITSVTVARGGHRWYASVLATVRQTIPDRPSERQRANGLIACDLGSQPLAVLSSPLDITDPDSRTIASLKPGRNAAHHMARAQRRLARCAKGSRRRRKAARHVAKIHHNVAQQRAGHLHVVSKRLATGAAVIALEDLDLVALTASAKGTAEEPGTNVRVRARFNRNLLDTGLGELRRQLTYKTRWYGSTLLILERGEATSTKCSRCGERNPNSTPGKARFTCPHCGLVLSCRDNAVRNIYKAARRAATRSVAPGRGDTQNARRDKNPPRTPETVTGPCR
ncbi:RNA-guided endonuclease InsQ/TnpB family protein [Streptomyces sp. HUAS TT7]|uniref:RNA-guided endonuclease InsQ/TnpB family protein n=1 Tax=Streptomyces sp. HUAS TT7 TaxID=3447507 RepID=UPI003F658761